MTKGSNTVISSHPHGAPEVRARRGPREVAGRLEAMAISIRINLTAEDRRSGIAGDPEYCPVARAAVRASGLLGGQWNVTPEFISWVRKEFTMNWATPNKARKWIREFDKYDGVDREGWRRLLIGSRFPGITFELEMNPHYASDSSRSIETKAVTIAIAKRRSGVSNSARTIA